MVKARQRTHWRGRLPYKTKQHYRHGKFFEVDTYDDRLTPPAMPLPHAPTHERSGTDEVNGDILDIDYVPTNYTRTVAPPQVTNVEELTAHLAGIDNRLIAALLTSDTFRFKGIGKIRVVVELDGAWIPCRAGNISCVYFYRRNAGTGGTTTIDISKNGTSIWNATPANRPAIDWTDGNNFKVKQTSFDVSSFVDGDVFTLDVDTAESGNPQDITVVIEVQYT